MKSVAVLMLVFSGLATADEYASMNDDDIMRLILDGHPDDDCLFWRLESRHYHTLFPENSPLPEEVRIDLIKKGHGLAGKKKMKETSVNYILKKRMFDMTVADRSPVETEQAVFDLCMKYDPYYTSRNEGGGDHPSPKLRFSEK